MKFPLVRLNFSTFSTIMHRNTNNPVIDKGKHPSIECVTLRNSFCSF